MWGRVITFFGLRLVRQKKERSFTEAVYFVPVHRKLAASKTAAGFSLCTNSKNKAP